MNKMWLLALTFLLVVTPAMAIELNGSTLFYNNSLAIQVQDNLGSHPFIFVNVPTTLRYKFYYNITNLVMDTATLTIDNNTYNLSYNIWEEEYQAQILFNTSEIGNYEYTVNGTLAGFSDATRTDTYRVVDYVTVQFNIYDTINKSHRYDNAFADIIAIPKALTDEEIYTEIAKPLTYLNDWVDIKMGIDYAKTFRSSYQLFWENYNSNGITTMIIPKNQSYTFYIVSGDQQYTDDFYGTMYYKKQTYSINLVQDHVMNDTTYDIYISSWETNWIGNFLTWIIWITAIVLIFAIPLAVYSQTGNPEMMGSTTLAVITIVPALAIFIQIIVAWLT